MLPFSQTPLLARLSAIFVGIALCISAAQIHAQQNPQATPTNTQAVAEIQRLMKQGQMPQALEKVDAYISTKPKDAQGRFLK